MIYLFQNIIIGHNGFSYHETLPSPNARYGNSASIYRVLQPAHRAAAADPPGIFVRRYRGFRLACIGAEVEAVKRAVDVYWLARHAAASAPAEREALNIEERTMRFAPKDWTGT